METLPQTRSSHLLPFCSVLREAGESTQALLRKSQLPSDCLDDPQSLIPSEAAFRFRELAARKLGLPNLASLATEKLEIADLGSFGESLLGAPTLYRLLSEFRDLTNTQTTMASIQLEQGQGGDVSLCYSFHHTPDCGLWESDFYVLQWTIKVVRLVDPTWSPDEIWSLACADPDRQRALEELGARRTCFHRDCSGFVVPHKMLALPLSRVKAMEDTCPVNEQQLRESAPANSFSGALEQVIMTYSSDRWLTIEQVAEVLDVSTRTLQRRLAEEGTSYTHVSEHARAVLAGELLTNTDMLIVEIARRLGYGDPGNLTRAFKRWSGISPRVYRQQRKPL